MNEHESLLTHLWKCSRIELYLDPKPLTAEHERLLKEMKRRRADGEPLQYILGYLEFMGLPMSVDHRVFIPRPETEILIDAAVRTIKERSWKDRKILDLGTGSGCMAIALAKELRGARITAVDISEEALQVARHNAEHNGVDGRMDFLEGDLFGALSRLKDPKEKIFDVVISNPPYIPRDQISQLPADVQKEPRLALDGGADGLDFYRRILRECKPFLTESALIIFEMGDGQKDAIERLFRDCGFQVLDMVPDYTGVERGIIGKWTNLL